MARTILTVEQMKNLTTEQQNIIIHEEMEKIPAGTKPKTSEELGAEIDELLAKIRR